MTISIHIFIYGSIFQYFRKPKICYWYNLIKCALNYLESTHMALQLDTFESGILCTSQCFFRSRWCHYIYSIKKAPETTLPLCFVNSGWDFLGTLLLQCWGGRHANVSHWKKNTAPEPAFSEAGPTSQSHKKGKGTERKQFELELRHASVNFYLMGLMLSSWFWFRLTRKILQTVLDNILSLLLSQRKHNEDVTQVIPGKCNACLLNV